MENILITLGIGAILIVGFFIVTEAITKLTGFSVISEEGNDFENCLEEQDITLYINTEDSVKTLNNIELKGYLENFKIFNCLRNNQVCLGNEVGSFPYTWIINENKFEKDISLQELIESSGCNLFK